jgi:predicted nucleic acid-binding protein
MRLQHFKHTIRRGPHAAARRVHRGCEAVDSDRPQKPFQRQINDIWIAATALENGGRVVAYDSHFEVVPGLIVEAP